MSLDMALDVSVGKLVEFRLTVENTANEPITVEFLTAQRGDVVVFDADRGEKVWQWSDGKMFTQMVEAETVEPGDHIEQTYEWADPKPGLYTGVATFRGKTGIEAREQFSV